MPIASAPRSGTARRCWNSISITEVVAGGCRGRGAPRGRLAAVDRRAVLAGLPVVQASKFELALLWQILSSTGFPNHFFCDSWVVGFWRGRLWLAGYRIGKASLDVGSSRFWISWATRRGDKCARSTCQD